MINRFLKNTLITILATSFGLCAGLCYAQTITETKNNTHKDCYVDKNKDYGLPKGVSFYVNPFVCVFSYDYGVITNGKKFGIATTQGKVVVPLNYDFISFIPFPIDWDSSDYQNRHSKIKKPTPKQILVMAMIDGKQGYINYANQIVVPIIYDRIDSNADKGFTRVWLDGKTGVVDVKGNTVVPIDYDFIEKFRFSHGLIAVSKDGKSGVFNHHGQLIIPVRYDKVDTQDKNIYIKKENKWGVFDHFGNEVIPISLKYEYLGSFSDGLAYVKTYDGKYGFINTQGKLVINSNYDYAESFDDGFSIIGLFRNSTDTADNYSLTLPSQDPNMTSDEFWSNVKADINSKKYGVINTQNEHIISIEYDSIRELDHTGFFTAEQNGKYGLFDNTGKIIIPIEYNDVQKEHSFLLDKPDSYQLIKVENNRKYGLYDTTGNLLTPVEYDAIIIKNDYAEAKNGKESHYYDWNGNLLDNNKSQDSTRDNAIDKDTP